MKKESKEAAASFAVALTPDEGTQLIQALDFLVRQTGLPSARMALMLTEKITKAHDAVFPPDPQ